jgi:hypothetical protein
MDRDNQKISSQSTNKVINLVSNKKNKKSKHDETGSAIGIDNVYSKIVGNQLPLHDRESMNDCHTYSRHVYSHSHSHENDIYMSHTKQVQCINMLYINYETLLIEKTTNCLHTHTDQILYTLLDDIKAKIYGYKRQDIKKFCSHSSHSSHSSCKLRKNEFTKDYISDNIISPQDTVELLVSNRLKCVYCKEPCYMIYKTQYDKKQWTLDRIDNSLGHTLNNVVVSCLECNIKRGTMNKERFEKGKQIRIIRKLQ